MISERRESAARKLGLWEEVWPFSPSVLKSNWRSKLTKTLISPQKEKKTRESRLAGRRSDPRRWAGRSPGSDGRQEAPRSGRTTSGWRSVAEALWQIGGGGGGSARAGREGGAALLNTCAVTARADVKALGGRDLWCVQGGRDKKSAEEMKRRLQTPGIIRIFGNVKLQAPREMSSSKSFYNTHL